MVNFFACHLNVRKDSLTFDMSVCCVSQGLLFPADPDPNAEAYMTFMKKHCCYDAIPTSCKLVIFDTSLQVKQCLYRSFIII